MKEKPEIIVLHRGQVIETPTPFESLLLSV
jgi:hypothetical protein